MALLSINGVDLPTPADYTVSKQDIVKAERNARGKMLKELIATKDKIDLTWVYLTQAQASQVLTAVKVNFFEATYFEPQTGAFRTAEFYRGDVSAPALSFINGTMRYKDLKFNIIER
ncbi:DUF6711 family protein [Bacillus sp. FJAT-26390]|uniref:DUF6711 family protein n=1 Tax=Bacillus sp. FJAT-26390 TaxID=1743142 RepID=UPI000807EAF0|nr:DUF6711 family protein [Bacillus sp. FJAT-26390]OBZ13333.1 hypothetical protein A7975_10775 [Bacillus sp. FJAT-26390]